MDIDELRIDLPKDLALLVRREVQDGTYASDIDMIRQALHLLQERRRSLDTVRGKIVEAAEDSVDITATDMRAHFERRFADLEPGGTP